MSEMEGFRILDSQTAAPIRAKKEDRPPPQSVARKKLADISNVPRNNKRPLIQEKSQSIDAKTYIDQLQKENMALVKILAHKNKIIEQSGVELDRLRVNLHKMKEQNQQLASSNSQMLADLNSGKDRIKLLQHELGCTSGLLKARTLQLEENAITKPSNNVDAQLQVEGESSKVGQDDEKPHNANMASQSDSLGTSEQPQLKEKTEPKSRRFTRRQSAIFKTVEPKPAEDSYETDETIVPPCLVSDDPVLTKDSTDESILVKDDDKKDSYVLENEAQEVEKPYLGRPSRVAAKKVQSYKEIPINVKMRRSQ